MSGDVRRSWARGKARRRGPCRHHVSPDVRRGQWLRPVLERLEGLILLANVSWVATQSGFWDVAANWSTRSVPGSADDVTINQPGVTVTIRSGAQAAHSLQSSDALALTGGSLTLAAASEIDGALALGAGTTLTTGGVLTLTGSDSWTGGTLAGGGSVALATGGTLAVSGATAGTLLTTLASAGTLDLQSDAGLTGTGSLQNAGTLKKSAGSGTSTIAVAVTSTGTVAVQSGTLALGTNFTNQGGTLDAESGTLLVPSTNVAWTGGGTFTAAAGATLQLAPVGGNGISLAGTYTGSGAGQVQFSGGTLLTGTGGATFNFPAGLFQWTGGTITANPGTLTNATTGFLTLSNAAVVTLNAAGSVINQGEIDQTGGGNLAINGTTFDNQAGATFDISGTGGLIGNGTFADEGTLKMTGSSTAAVTVASNLDGGILDAENGTLVVQSTNCNWTGGTLTAATGATVQLASTGGNGISLAGTYTGSGGGQVQLSSGTLQTGTGGATFNFPAGLFQWTGGTITASTRGMLVNATISGFPHPEQRRPTSS